MLLLLLLLVVVVRVRVVINNDGDDVNDNKFSDKYDDDTDNVNDGHSFSGSCRGDVWPSWSKFPTHSSSAHLETKRNHTVDTINSFTE